MSVKYYKKTIIEDEALMIAVKDEGVGATSRRIQMNKALLSNIINGNRVISEETYEKLKNKVLTKTVFM